MKVFLVSLCLALSSGFAFSQKIDSVKLAGLVFEAREAHSDGLIILQDDKVLVEEYFGTPLTPTYVASVGKALVSIAIIKLLNDGKIKSIDQPVSDFYPEWKQGKKKSITLRMILSHTSGMQNEKNSRLEIETGPNGSGDDLVKLALAAEISTTPGTVYEYNNKAICLLPGIIEVASGMRMDKYFEKTFFKPMHIRKYEWKRDGTGRPQGHAGFMLLPLDLAKFGQLMLNGGEYGGRRFFEKRWVDSSIVASQEVNKEVGLTWNLFLTSGPGSYFFLDESNLELFSRVGISDSIIQKLRGLQGKKFYNPDEIRKSMVQLFGDDWIEALRPSIRKLPNGERDFWKISKGENISRGYYHTGSWGNYLVIIPELKLVAVRVVKRDKEYNGSTDLLGGFVSKVFGLLPKNY